MKRHKKRVKVFRKFMKLVRFDVDSDGMAETDARVVKFYDEFFHYYDDPIAEAVKQLKSFDSPKKNGLVRVKSSFSAFCEHHLLPFMGTVRVVYVPNGKVTGISKLPRGVRVLCSRPQIQERITSEMADVIMKFNPLGVLVDIEAQHSCMMIRGITDPCSSTRTQEVRGVLETDPHLLNRALSMLNQEK
jgi:GTP cyclohydrolase IA